AFVSIPSRFKVLVEVQITERDGRGAGVTGKLPYHPNIDVAAHHHHSASVIGILQVTGTVICICYDYQSGVRNAPRDLDRITNQLIGLRAVLENLLTLARTEDMSGLSRL